MNEAINQSGISGEKRWWASFVVGVAPSSCSCCALVVVNNVFNKETSRVGADCCSCDSSERVVVSTGALILLNRWRFGGVRDVFIREILRVLFRITSSGPADAAAALMLLNRRWLEVVMVDSVDSGWNVDVDPLLLPDCAVVVSTLGVDVVLCSAVVIVMGSAVTVVVVVVSASVIICSFRGLMYSTTVWKPLERPQMWVTVWIRPSGSVVLHWPVWACVSSSSDSPISASWCWFSVKNINSSGDAAESPSIGSKFLLNKQNKL